MNIQCMMYVNIFYFLFQSKYRKVKQYFIKQTGISNLSFLFYILSYNNGPLSKQTNTCLNYQQAFNVCMTTTAGYELV